MRIQNKRLYAGIFILAFLVAALFLFKAYAIYMRPRWQYWRSMHSDSRTRLIREFREKCRGEGGFVFAGTSLTYGLHFRQTAHSTITILGIPGEFTCGLPERLNEIKRCRPEKIFIETGINDLLSGFSADETMQHCEKLIDALRDRFPDTQIYIQSLLPVCFRDGLFVNRDDISRKIRVLNARLRSYCGTRHITYVELYAVFELQGALNPALSTDGVHLNAAGYAKWKMRLRPYLTANNK